MRASKTVRTIGLLAVVAVSLWYISSHLAELALLREFRRAYLAPLILVHLGTLGLNGWMNGELIACFGPRLPVTHWYGLAALNAFGNYLPLPQAGAAVRGAYLKRLHGVGYRKYAASVLFAYVVSVALIGIVGVAALVFLATHGARVSWLAWLAFGAMAASAALLAPGLARRIPGRALAEFANGYDTLSRGGLLPRLIGAKLALIAINATGIWLAYRSLGHPVGWVPSAVVSLATMASGVINVTPGNVGTSEAAAWGAAASIGQDHATAVNAALIGRLTAAIVVFTLGPLFATLLGSRQAPTAPADPATPPGAA